MAFFKKKPAAPKPPKEPKTATMVDSRQTSHKLNKLWFTVVWLCMALASAVFVAMAFATLKNLRRIYYNELDLAGNVGYVYDRNYIWGAIYATSVTPILVIVFIFLGTSLVVKKFIRGTGITYSVGVLHCATFLLAFVMLQSALGMHAFKKAAQDDWEKRPGGKWSRGTTSLYIATYVFAYFLFVGYLALLLALILFKNVMKRLNHVAPPPGAPVTPSPHTAAEHDAGAAHAVVHVSSPTAAGKAPSPAAKLGATPYHSSESPKLVNPPSRPAGPYANMQYPNATNALARDGSSATNDSVATNPATSMASGNTFAPSTVDSNSARREGVARGHT